MPFEKGKVTNPKGRKAGVPNKATQEFKEKLNDLLEHAAPHMVEWLDAIAKESPEKAFDILSKFVEYIHPKLARHDSTVDHKGGITIDWALPKTQLDD